MVLTGKTFVGLIKNVLECFNEQKMPIVKTQIEALMNIERKNLLESATKFAMEYLESHKNNDELL